MLKFQRLVFIVLIPFSISSLTHAVIDTTTSSDSSDTTTAPNAPDNSIANPTTPLKNVQVLSTIKVTAKEKGEDSTETNYLPTSTRQVNDGRKTYAARFDGIIKDFTDHEIKYGFQNSWSTIDSYLLS